jgi:pyroglutamyl-peptidase
VFLHIGPLQPFGDFKENPSWLAVKALHDTIISTAGPTRGKPPKGAKPDSIHLTAINIPTVYSAVLDTLPGLHAQPPVVPELYTPPTSREPPEAGYDLIVHVGVGRKGGLVVERLAHKTGYQLSDHEEQSPPIIIGKGDLRGFGSPQYGDEFADELLTPIDVDVLVGDLTSGPEPLVSRKLFILSSCLSFNCVSRSLSRRLTIRDGSSATSFITARLQSRSARGGTRRSCSSTVLL